MQFATLRNSKPFTTVQPRHAANRMTTRAIKLYTNPGSRGKMSEWYLDELGVQYDTVNLNMKAGQHKQPDFLAINPFGKVPAMVDDGQPIFESGAILIHLASKYGKESNLGAVAQWVLFANSTFSEAFFVRGLLKVLDGLLAKSTWITGETFNAADVAVAGYLLYLPMFFPDLDLSPYPNVWRYMQAAAEKPSCPAPYKEAMDAAVAARKGSGGNIFNRMMGR